MRSNLMNDAMNPVHRFLVLLAEDVFGVSQSLAGENSRMQRSRLEQSLLVCSFDLSTG